MKRSLSLTHGERSWILYDVGNSAFILFATSVVPIYFASLASNQNVVVAWGYAESIASLVVALLMPFLGSLADYQGNKIKFFTGFFLTGLIACFALAMPLGWFAFLAIYVVSSIGINSSITFYDAMIVDVTTDERMDRVSSHGYAWGYVGSCIPFIACIGLIFGAPLLHIDQALVTRLCFVLIGVWWLLFTIPLLKSYKQVHYKERCEGRLKNSLHNMLKTVQKIRADKIMLIFMLAYCFYIDGVHAVIKMATSYGTQLGIDGDQLILALLISQFVAFPSALIYGHLAGRIGTLSAIKIAVIAYALIVLFAAFFLRSAREFWFLAVMVGLFQGGIQALSRSYFGKLVPKKNANEFYGFFEILGKYSAIMGTLLVAGITQLTGKANFGILSVALLFIVGFFFLCKLPHRLMRTS